MLAGAAQTDGRTPGAAQTDGTLEIEDPNCRTRLLQFYAHDDWAVHMNRLFEMGDAVGIEDFIKGFEHGGGPCTGLTFNIDAAQKLYDGMWSIEFDQPRAWSMGKDVDITSFSYEKYVECKKRPQDFALIKRDNVCHFITQANKKFKALDYESPSVFTDYNREVWIDLREARFTNKFPLDKLDDKIKSWWTLKGVIDSGAHSYIDRIVIWVSDTDIRIYDNGIRNTEADLLTHPLRVG